MAIDFRDWVTWVFDQPVPEPSLYWNAGALGPWKASADLLAVISRLFEEPAGVLRHYSDQQLNQGFWFLCGAESDAMRGLADEAIAWEARARCIRSFGTLFRELFQARCSAHLSHLMRAAPPEDSGLSPLNSACYMWWDFDCWRARPGDGAHQKVDAAYLEVMGQALALSHDACRESALHGLGHWHRAYPVDTERIVDDFLASNPGIREELRRYALAARSGCIQ